MSSECFFYSCSLFSTPRSAWELHRIERGSVVVLCAKLMTRDIYLNVTTATTTNIVQTSFKLGCTTADHTIFIVFINAK